MYSRQYRIPDANEIQSILKEHIVAQYSETVRKIDNQDLKTELRAHRIDQVNLDDQRDDNSSRTIVPIVYLSNYLPEQLRQLLYTQPQNPI